MSTEISPEEAYERLAKAVQVLGNPRLGSFGGNALEVAIRALTDIQLSTLLKIDGVSTEKFRVKATNQHPIKMILTDEELTGLHAMKRASKTTLSDEEFARFIIREHLHRKGFHP
ncbi:MAG: hypothetical protein E6R03_02770 [Hyphomicrobiaceae bacterium]|nr:MAG: hypothetical protein E6R03_02770 [Hyphomicrobiaceae bacterium]